MTFTVTLLEAVQPLTAVPVTVYVLVASGINDIPLDKLSDHEYVDAPEPLRVTEVPEHTVVDGETVVPTVGRVLTVTVTVLVFEHPLVVPVTV